MSNEEQMTTRDKLEKILRLADELLIEMSEDFEELDEEPRKRVRGLGYVGEKPRKAGTRWSQEDDEHLVLMVNAGWDMNKIADVLERPLRGVQQRPDQMKAMGTW